MKEKEFDFCPDGIEGCKECPNYFQCSWGPGAIEVDGDLYVGEEDY